MSGIRRGSAYVPSRLLARSSEEVPQTPRTLVSLPPALQEPTRLSVIVSDLHLADGDAILDGFGDAQEAALEGLLDAANSGRLVGRTTNHVELIINGDCFDFLAIPPFQKDETTDPATALGKLEKVVAAHTPFFEKLHEFISTPGRSVTFITGNHDIELGFEEVRARIAEAIHGQTVILRSAQDDKSCDTESQGGRVHFCTARFYRSVPDVYIEHGNQYDFWNHISDLWEEKGQAFSLSPSTIRLPFGSQYMLRVGYPISLAHPYFDHFEPSLNILRQVALLSLLDPDLTRATAERLMEMLSYPRKALADLAPGEEHIPARLFELAMLDFLAFQQDIEARSPAWVDTNVQENSISKEAPSAMTEFMALQHALTLPTTEAIAAICTPKVYAMGEDVAQGMQQVLRRSPMYDGDPSVRYAIAGHTHMWRIDALDDGRQTYLNTGTWTKRVALPTPDEMTPALVEWLRQPDWQHIPLRDMTQFTFAMIATHEDGPSEARLCVWEGGANEGYRVIGEERLSS